MSRIQKYTTAMFTVALTIVTMLFGGITAFAANVTISFSDPAATVGSEVSVRMKIQSAEGSAISRADVMLAYDTSMLEFVSGSSATGGAGAIRVAEAADTAEASVMEFNLTFRALQAGNASITINTQEVYDSDNQLMSLQNQGSSAVTIAALEGSSNIAELRDLVVSPGNLNPVFAADVYEYSMTVGADVTKVAVSPILKDEGKAKVIVTGNDALTDGENKIICQVTAEDGVTVKNYTITVMKGSGAGENAGETAVAGDLRVTIQDQEYAIASSWNDSSLPEGFEKNSYTYSGQEISIGKGLEKNLILFYLINANNEGAFFIYDETASTFVPYVQLETSRKAIVVLAPDPAVTLPPGFTESTISIENQIVQGWVWATETNHEYCIFYAMNWNGEKGFYRYDTKEKTIQRYFQDPALVADGGQPGDTLSETYQQLQKQYQRRLLIIIILVVLAVVSLGIAGVVLMKRTRQRLGFEDDYSDFDEEETIKPAKTVRQPVVEDQFIKELEQQEELEKELESKLEEAEEVVLMLDPDQPQEDEEEDDDFEYISIDD